MKRRRCAWCAKPLPVKVRRHARYCPNEDDRRQSSCRDAANYDARKRGKK